MVCLGTKKAMSHCCAMPAGASCASSETVWDDYRSWMTHFIDRHFVGCGSDEEYLTGFVLRFDSANRIKFEFTCCNDL